MCHGKGLNNKITYMKEDYEDSLPIQKNQVLKLY